MPVVDAFQSRRFDAAKMQKVNLFESPHYFCDVYCLEPGQEQAPHAHEREEKLYYVMEGRGTVTLGAEQREIRAGEIAMARAGESHGIRNTSDARLTCLVFMAPHPKPERFAGS